MQTEGKAPAQLSPARRALLQQYLLGGLRPSKTEPAGIPKRMGSGPAPLSHGQQQIWLDSQLAGESLIYNEPVTIHRQGELDVSALERSFTEIVRRHEAWRTTFEWDGDQGVQIVHAAPTRIEIPFIDLRAHPQPETEAIRLATEDALQPFDLARGPLYRTRLVRIGVAEHRLFLTLHHIIFDGVSLYQVFLPELQTLYEAFAKNETLLLSELPIQYADYAVWQRDSLKKIPPEQLSYWQTVCDDLPVLNLKTDHPRSAVHTYAGAMVTLQISSSTTAALKILSQEQGVTAFTTMVASFMALLHGYTGQEDIVIGTAIDGRNHTETEGLLGFFLNTILIRCAFSKELPFTELLKRVRSATLGALSHDAVPFELLVQKFAGKRDLSRGPLFQVLMSIEPPLTPLKDGWAFTQMDVEIGTAKFDLHLELDDRADGLIGRFIYNTDLFERETIKLLKARWLQLLDRIATAPTESVRELTAAAWRDAAALDRPLVEWNNTRTNYPRDAVIHEVFEDEARRRPSNVAVVFGDAQLSYDELNRRANQLARRLEKLGVGRDVPVGVCMNRSLEMVTALLGVLKAGGAYVPLDPAYPAERLALMINDAGSPVILTQTRVKNCCLNAAREVLCLDAGEFADEDDTNPTNEVRANDLAYIMYTSGSTGAPKGVAVMHRGVVRLVKETSYASFSPHETFLQLAPISFDASTFEIWGALLNGGKLVVMPPEPPSLEEIGSAIHEHGVTTLWLTAGLFNAMVDERLRDLRPLRQLLAGGDVLSVPHVRKALSELENTRLINGYGPTESTTFACCHTIDSNAPLDGPVPIGKPIANTTAYILDPNLQLVPVGISGELFIGGDGLARGYWRREELTAEKFIADPFNTEPGARLYQTGDLARWRSDGIIEFLGRADNQIKLRGFRIEPGEIESVLKKQADVLDSAVIVREDRPGDKQLVAYVVCKQGATLEAKPSKSALIAALKKSLPSYMVPSEVIVLGEIPLTPNGKTDRNALKLMANGRAQGNASHDRIPERALTTAIAIPRDEVQAQLLNIWEDVLGHSAIGVHDNFFELGGHSLLAVRMLALIEKRLGPRVPLATLFDEPTIEHIATELLKGQKLAAIESPYVLINASGRKTPVFFFHGDFDGGGFFCKTFADVIGADRPFYALHPHGFHGDSVPLSIEAMAADRIRLIRQVQPRGPYILGGYCNGALIAYHTARLLRAAGQEVATLLMLVALGTNVRFRWLKRITGVTSAMCGDDDAQRQQRFLTVRQKYVDRENLARHYWRATIRLAKQPPRKQAERLWSFVGKKTGFISGPTPTTNPLANTDPPSNAAITAAYSTACDAFVPENYDSQVVLFWPRDERPFAGGPAAGWDRVCSRFEVVEVPGNHGGCILRNANATIVGEAMRHAITKSQAL
jgi:aspartate racemase